ncbi:heme peroxidase [Blyttiomyces helicus]|uniref:Heme peroxidase n=1 Tax=Blyttiomyces helicus TaxID=388810 RepID=A0A4V1IRM7_9FUNG|nr:heme peroxidase [Blyttiomyces helicus]|eukprot:RKO90597.1 heme peroxidase [Blyttiomyces helicus]
MAVANTTTLLTEVQPFDGWGNNVQNPSWGAAGWAFARPTVPDYDGNDTGKQESTGDGLIIATPPAFANRPNARLVSSTLLAIPPAVFNDELTSDLMASWGIYIHADVNLAERSATETANITVPTGDTVFDPYSLGNVTIPLFRTNATFNSLSPRHPPVIYVDPRTGTSSRVYRNVFTATLDASGLYGCDDSYATIMTGERGMLKSWVHPVAGEVPFVDNETGLFTLGGPPALGLPHIAMFQILLLREHNRRARQIAVTNPDWTDAQIFNRARRMVIAIVQKITLGRYYPLLLGEVAPAYAGYDPNVDPSIDLFWANVAQRYGHTSTNQVLLRYEEDGLPSNDGHVRLVDVVGSGTTTYILQTGMEPFLRGFAMQPENKIDSRYVEEIRNSFGFGTNLSSFPQRYDLAAVDIQKYRETGLPDYNAARRYFNLSEISTWSDLTNDTQIQGILASLYPEINRLDAYVGAMIEPHQGNAIVGPLNAASIKDQLLRIRSGDRFWWENPGVLTEEELGEMNNYSGLGQVCSSAAISDPVWIVWGGVSGWGRRDVRGNARAYAGVTDRPSLTNPLRLVAPCDLIPGLSCSKTASSSPEEGLNVMGMITLKWVMNNSFTNNPAITFTIESNSTGTDFVIPKADILVRGTNDVIDITDLTSSQTVSKRVLRFTRYLNTGDSRDIVIESGVMPLLFAYGAVPAIGYHGPNDRTQASLDFFNSGSGVIVVSDSGSDMTQQLKILHGVIMALAFGAFYPSGIFIARFWDDPRWLRLHQPLMSMASESVLIAALTAIVTSDGALTFTHPKIGLAIASFSIMSSMSGITIAKAHTRFPLTWSRLFRRLHRGAGYSGYLLGIANGFIGVLDISGNDWPLAYGFLAYVVSVLIVLSGIHHMWKTRIVVPTMTKSRWSITGMSEAAPRFAWTDVASRVRGGAKWIVIENSVYDVDKFMEEHPGGPEVINRHLGEDATESFQRQNHSRLARTMMRDMMVGRVMLSKPTKQLDDGYLAYPIGRSILASQEIVFSETREVNLPVSKQTLALDPTEFRSLEIVGRESLTERSVARPAWKLRLDFENPTDTVIFRPGDCIHLMFTREGKNIVREYTPIKTVNTGYMDLVIKMINGEMTSHLLHCATIAVRGPKSHTMCLNPHSATGCWNKIAMIAGGTGITPMLLMIDYHMQNAPRSSSGHLAVELSLLHVFQKDDGIFGVAFLDALENEAHGALKVHRLIADGNQRKITSDDIASMMPFQPPSLKKPSHPHARRQSVDGQTNFERRGSHDIRGAVSTADTAILICGYAFDRWRVPNLFCQTFRAPTLHTSDNLLTVSIVNLFVNTDHRRKMTRSTKLSRRWDTLQKITFLSSSGAMCTALRSSWGRRR